jgi:hypothetical protein
VWKKSLFATIYLFGFFPETWALLLLPFILFAVLHPIDYQGYGRKSPEVNSSRCRETKSLFDQKFATKSFPAENHFRHGRDIAPEGSSELLPMSA